MKIKDKIYNIQDNTLLVICFLGVLFGNFFGYLAISRGDTILGFVDFSMGVIFLVDGYLVLKKPGSFLPKLIIMITACSYFFYLFTSGGTLLTGYIWGILIPIAGFLFLGLRWGLYINVIYFIAMITAYFVSVNYIDTIVFIPEYLFVRFVALFITTGIISYIYESSRVKDQTLILNEVEMRKKSENELIKFKQAVEQSPSSIVITDLKGIIEYTNTQFELVTGYSSNEVVGNNINILKSGLTKPESYKELWHSITNGKVWRGVFNNKRKDQVIYIESVMISPIFDNNGMITSYLGVKEDITTKAEADKKNEDLFKETSRMNRLMIGREKRIIELKQEVNKLSKLLNQEIIYDSVED